MVRASSKSSVEKQTKIDTVVSESSSVPVVLETDAGVEKVKAKRAPKKKVEVSSDSSSVPVVSSPVAVPSDSVVVSDETVASTDDVVVDKSTPSGALLAEIAEFNKNFQAWSNFGNALKANIKNITKISSRVSKNAEKSSKRKKNAKSKPSGFEKPTPISDELAIFFGKDLGSLMARTEVSKNIHDYVMQQKLQNASNRRIIHPDAKLKQLLKVNNDELTYFNLQKYLKFHFKKEPVVVPVAKA
jgi:chromatin remodeling complex protein RSC6